MAIKKGNQRRLNAVRIISRYDEAVDENESKWEDYDRDPMLNEKALKFKPNMQPTVFLCNFELTGKESAAAKDHMVTGVDEDRNPRLAYGKWQYAIVKMTLKAIENPPGVDGVIELRKDPRGYVSDETMTDLEREGIVAEIFNHYLALTQSSARREAKN